MNKKNAYLILFTLMLTITTYSAIATEYLMPGYNKQSDYATTTNININGAGMLINGNLILNGSIPLSADLLGDGNNELILLTHDNYLYVQNYTGSTFTNLASVYIGSTQLSHRDQRITPGILDYDNDGNKEIIMQNQTHFLVYNYTLASGLTLEQSATYLTNTSDTGVCGGAVTKQYSIIKCSSNGLPDGIKACFMLGTYHDAGIVYDELYMYDLTNNTVKESQVTSAYCNFNHDQGRNLFLLDMNNNGLYEPTFGIYDSANGDNNIYMTTLSTGDVMSTSLLYLNNMAAGYWNSDITVGNFDGITSNGNEIGLLYRSAAAAYSYKVLNNAGAVLKTDLVTGIAGITFVIQYTGSTPSTNLVSVPTSNPAACGLVYNLSSTAGFNGYAFTVCFSTTEQQTLYYSSSGAMPPTGFRYSRIYANGTIAPLSPVGVYGTTGLLQYLNKEFLGSVLTDYYNNGGAQVMLSNDSAYAFFDSFYSNSAPQVLTKGFGTGSPACLGVVQKYTVTAIDAENDPITCFTETTYINGTSKYNTTPQTAASPVSFTFLETLSTEGNFYVLYHCKDAYHTYGTQQMVLTVSNVTGCNAQDQNPTTINLNTSSTVAQDANFQASVDSTLNTLGIAGSKAKNFLWIIIMLGCGVGIAVLLRGMNGTAYIVTFVEVLLLVLGWTIGMVSTVVLVMVAIICALLVTLFWLRPGTAQQ